MIAHGDRKAPCRAATCAPIRIIYQRRMVNALLSIVQRNCSRTFACVHSICGDIGAINDSIIAQHVNILRREASNGSVGSDRESIPHFGRPLHVPRVVSPPKSVSGILLGSTRSDLGGYTSKGGAPVLSPARSPLADFDLIRLQDKIWPEWGSKKGVRKGTGPTLSHSAPADHATARSNG